MSVWTENLWPEQQQLQLLHRMPTLFLPLHLLPSSNSSCLYALRASYLCQGSVAAVTLITAAVHAERASSPLCLHQPSGWLRWPAAVCVS